MKLLGVVGALALSRFVANFLYGVSTVDLKTYVAMAFLLGGIALAAAYVPARRATSVDPIEALRYE